jgi:hypothetical protein
MTPERKKNKEKRRLNEDIVRKTPEGRNKKENDV